MRRTDYSLLFVRLGLGAVFILFGYDKLLHPENWIIFCPPQASEIVPFSLYTFLKLQGTAETLLGTALGLGFMTRLSAFFTTVILGLIIFFLWLDPIAVRDIGLLCASLALVISGGGRWSLERLFDHQDRSDKTRPERTL